MSTHISAGIADIQNTADGDLRRVTITAVESQRTPTATNELLPLLHAMGRKGGAIKVPENNRFTYKLPFRLK